MTPQIELLGAKCLRAGHVAAAARFLEPVSPDDEGGVPPDDQLLTSLEVQLLHDIRRTVGQLAATAWAQDNLPVPQVSRLAARLCLSRGSKQQGNALLLGGWVQAEGARSQL